MRKLKSFLFSKSQSLGIKAYFTCYINQRVRINFRLSKSLSWKFPLSDSLSWNF